MVGSANVPALPVLTYTNPAAPVGYAYVRNVTFEPGVMFVDVAVKIEDVRGVYSLKADDVVSAMVGSTTITNPCTGIVGPASNLPLPLITVDPPLITIPIL